MTLGLPSQMDAWRVAALTTMSDAKLAAVLGGDPRAAIPWVVAAAKLGIVEAQIRLARMLLAGEGVTQDTEAAFAWLNRAAETGNSDAQNMLGRCYENGWGVTPNTASAAEWYTRAAEAGDAWAQYNLGHLLLDGNGVVRNADAAFRWYKRAADQDHARAMNLVGRCFEQGWGTPRDLVEARRWYQRSAEGRYFRGAFNYASVLAASGCVEGATYWYRRAVALAPEDKRPVLIAAWRRVRTNPPPARHSPLQKQEARA